MEMMKPQVHKGIEKKTQIYFKVFSIFVFIATKIKFSVQNFIDLAGSERASLSQSDGTRLKEGCYINRSLLTLSTVIRKLRYLNAASMHWWNFKISSIVYTFNNIALDDAVSQTEQNQVIFLLEIRS